MGDSKFWWCILTFAFYYDIQNLVSKMRTQMRMETASFHVLCNAILALLVLILLYFMHVVNVAWFLSFTLLENVHCLGFWLGETQS